MRYVGFCLLVWATSVFACDEKLLRQASSPSEVWQILDLSEQATVLSVFGGDQVKAWAGIEIVLPKIRALAKHVESLDSWSEELKTSYRKLVATTVLNELRAGLAAPIAITKPGPVTFESLFAQDEVLKQIYELNDESLKFQKRVFQSESLKTLLERFWLVEREVKQYGHISRTNLLMLVSSPVFAFEQELNRYVSGHADLVARTEDLIQGITARIEGMGEVNSSGTVRFQKLDLLVGARSTMELLLIQLGSLQQSLTLLETPVQEIQDMLVGSLVGDAKITPQDELYLALDGLKKVAKR